MSYLLAKVPLLKSSPPLNLVVVHVGIVVPDEVVRPSPERGDADKGDTVKGGTGR